MQELEDARLAAKDLQSRSLLQKRGNDYAVHDLLLNFVKVTIEEFEAIKKIATSRQAGYLGRLDVLSGYLTWGKNGDLYSLVALWRSLEELSGDTQLEENTYKSSLEVVERSGVASLVADNFASVASLFNLQVCTLLPYGSFGYEANNVLKATNMQRGIRGTNILRPNQLVLQPSRGAVLKIDMVNLFLKNCFERVVSPRH